MLIDVRTIGFVEPMNHMGMIIDMVSTDELNGTRILRSYDEWTALWHLEPYTAATAVTLAAAIHTLHRANFELWHLEDKARDVNAGDAAIAAAKRTIDRVNQQRNDQMEHCDALLLKELAAVGLPNLRAELHSETFGLMLDRLSILSLKRYHTLEEIERPAAPEGHRERNRQRLTILETQRNDLAECLDRLWAAVLQGTRRFQIYRQLKMYNDADLNPTLYGSRR